MSDDEEVTGEVCREAAPQIGGEDWESPLADGSKVEGWHDQLVGGRRSKSLSRCCCHLLKSFEAVKIGISLSEC